MSVYYSGSPFVTGHAGFRLLRKLHLRRPFLAAENALLSLPESLQQRLCFSMTAIFRATTTVTHEGVQQ